MENKEKISTPSDQPMRPPPQPLDIKKSGVPAPVLLFIVIFGFSLAAAVFAFLSKQSVKNGQDKLNPVSEIKKSAPQTIMEIVEPKPTDVSLQEKPADEKPVPVLTLSGILVSKKESMALINGRIVPEGEMVSGAKVVKVGLDTVELDFEGKKIILRSR